MEIHFNVAGYEHYMKNVMKTLACPNNDYDLSKSELMDFYGLDERVYQYDNNSFNADLVPDQNNIHDKNAIKIVVDDLVVGYVKKGSVSKVKKLMEDPKYLYSAVELKGGKYKLLWEDEDEKVHLEKGELPYSVHLYVFMEGD